MIVAVPSADAAAWMNPRVPAAIAAAVAAYLTHSTLKTLAVGMLALWSLQWLAGAFG
jgi:branched-subunit amino acid transport protein